VKSCDDNTSIPSIPPEKRSHVATVEMEIVPQEWRIQNQVERNQQARKAVVLLIFTHHEKKMLTVIKLIQTFSTQNFRDLCKCTPYSILLFFSSHF
jgi:phosphorylcholine metabolism protein LicD